METILVALLLAFLPYLLVRGPVNRMARNHKGVQKLSIVIIATLCFASVVKAQDPQDPTPGEESPPPQSPSAPGKWEFSVTPYIFLARLNGTVGVVGQSAEVNASFSDIFRNLEFAAMGTFEARKGNWSVLVDGMYISLEGQKVTPSPFFSDINVEVKETIITPLVGYRVLKVEGGSIDLTAGARVWRVKSHLTFQPRILPLVDVEDSKTWADPIVGARGFATLTPRTFFQGEFDAGGFGINSDFTGQVFGGVGFQWKPRIALVGGYRYLRVDYKDDGFVYKTALSGPTIGVKLRL